MHVPRESVNARLQRLQYLNAGLVLALVALSAGTLFEAMSAHTKAASQQKVADRAAVTPEQGTILSQTASPASVTSGHTIPVARSMPSPHPGIRYFHRAPALAKSVRHSSNHSHRRIYRHRRAHRRYYIRYGPITFDWDGDD